MLKSETLAALLSMEGGRIKGGCATQILRDAILQLAGEGDSRDVPPPAPEDEYYAGE